MKEALFADQCSAFGLGEASAIKVDSARFSTCCSKAFAFDEICCGSLKSWQDHAKTRTASEGRFSSEAVLYSTDTPKVLSENM